MSVAVQVQIQDDISALVQDLVADTGDMKGINEAIAVEALVVTVNHLLDIALNRHDSANRLQANPTGHWEDPLSYTESRFSADDARVSIRKPGISRVGRDVTITPGAGKKYLALPASPEAYGHRPAEFDDLVFIATAGVPVLAKKEGEQLTVFYFLVQSVTQKQDRTLLPFDAEYSAAAVRGVTTFVRKHFERSSNGLAS